MQGTDRAFPLLLEGRKSVRLAQHQNSAGFVANGHVIDLRAILCSCLVDEPLPGKLIQHSNRRYVGEQFSDQGTSADTGLNDGKIDLLGNSALRQHDCKGGPVQRNGVRLPKSKKFLCLLNRFRIGKRR